MLVRLGHRVGLRWFSSGITRVATLLRDKPVDKIVKVNGWVKAIRKQKERTFLDVDDGSCLTKLQVVLASEHRPSTLGYHCAVSVTGTLLNSTHKGQEVELLADQVQVIGSEMQLHYPFKARQKHPSDYIRQYPHLRPRTNTFASTLRVRSQMKMSIHRYFEREGFINIDTPILTANDCEGGGEVFEAKHCGKEKENSSDSKTEDSYFLHPTYLTVSGQLHLEAMANGLSKVYNFSPAFRGENSLSRRHLTEFWMAEAEEAFMEGADGLELLLKRVENMLKQVMINVIDVRKDDVTSHWSLNKGTEERVRRAIDEPFKRLTYTEALDILNKSSKFPLITPGDDLHREHELYLTHCVGESPVFVTHWPLKCKPFYMCADKEDPSLALAMDLLVPDIGEVAGGSLREHRLASLLSRYNSQTLPNEAAAPIDYPKDATNLTDPTDPLTWYLDLRALGGGVPSGGYGVGVERLLQFVLGISNARDAIPFPRWVRHCPC